jgi:hypothetical protein
VRALHFQTADPSSKADKSNRERAMRSKHLPNFGIPDVEHDVEVARDTQGLPRLFLRHPGNPLVGLDIGGMSRLKQMMDQDGDSVGAQEMARYIEQAKALGLGPSTHKPASPHMSAPEPSPLHDGFQVQVYPAPRSGR